MKIYKFLNGEMLSTIVIKETPVRYYINPAAGFGYDSFVCKDFACTTKEQAKQEAINKATGKVRFFSNKLEKAKQDLSSAISFEA